MLSVMMMVVMADSSRIGVDLHVRVILVIDLTVPMTRTCVRWQHCGSERLLHVFVVRAL